ncbi:hypothetical protein RVF83_07950 [Gordonia rubripertincta]|uniref:DUF7144 domain-containing protein n=2 Tax=Gordonia rubripertincta TaxID=36822 RepID=A0AAW6R947_GORRU|nr:hypothetical protein [Gordonia rubripertincta]ASR01317.1 hypothetical protein GCWB2_02435 [Gordonia rubripertincta]MBM7279991.1 hypothetical protein [Gordonia rubripertincta]MDG6780905.1 hypothetical protein [Gordonia rubripertincta]NKY63342.1 hypothetical protein [Gordonia rubripertincta]QMU22208.1 hypothetical protein H3V45_06915 [Gordonia rubripertincta]
MSASTDQQANSSAKQGFAFGISIVAAALLFVAGLVSVFQGISAIANDELFVVGRNYVFEFDLTTWGWIHLILGIVGILIAGGLAVGADWARIAAIVIASLSIIAQFLWLPYYPAWAILIIVLDLIVIWAVSTWNPNNAYNL